MKRDLEMITKWQKESGLVVNEAKSELCFFNRRDTQMTIILLNDSIDQWKNQINVSGVIFDSKLQWSAQLVNAIKNLKGCYLQ